TAIAHNGNIMNADKLRRDLEQEGSILQSSSDTEVLAHLIRKNGHLPMEEAIVAGLNQLVGAYAFIILTEHSIYVELAPRGIRRVVLGNRGDAYVVASEACAFNIVGATIEREVTHSELLTINHEGIMSRRFLLREPRKLCAME